MSLPYPRPASSDKALMKLQRNRAVYSYGRASGGDEIPSLQLASPPVATRNGLAPPVRIGASPTVNNIALCLAHISPDISYLGHHARECLESQTLLIPQPIGSGLEHPDFTMHHLTQVLAPLKTTISPVDRDSNPLRGVKITHTKPRRARYLSDQRWHGFVLSRRIRDILDPDWESSR